MTASKPPRATPPAGKERAPVDLQQVRCNRPETAADRYLVRTHQVDAQDQMFSGPATEDRFSCLAAAMKDDALLQDGDLRGAARRAVAGAVRLAGHGFNFLLKHAKAAVTDSKVGLYDPGCHLRNSNRC